jgi:general secretion pathway protein G
MRTAHGKQGSDGFTLIELMIVVIIIAALAAMVMPKLWPATNAAKTNIAKGDISNIKMALELYRLYNDHFPTTQEGLDILLKPSGSRAWTQAYLEKSPIDPWGRKYEYKCPGTKHPDYDIWSNGPDPQQTTDDVWPDE